jgi:hypothetical protein
VTATATTTALALRLIKLITVILHAQIISGSTKPVVLCVDLFFGNSRVGDLLGKIDAGTETSYYPAIDVERLERELLRCTLTLVLLGVDLGSKTGDPDNFLRGANQDTLSRGTGTSGTTGSVNIHICCTRDVIVNNTINSLDIETTGCDISGDKD